MTALLVVMPARGVPAQRSAAPSPAPRAPRIDVVWPEQGAVLDIGDSTFFFGSVSDTSARIVVAGQAAHVAGNGAWIAWVALPDDSVIDVPIEARTASDTTSTSIRVVRAVWSPHAAVWVDRRSMTPSGEVWMPAGEALPLTVRAAPGAIVRLRLPDGRLVVFAADSIAEPVASGITAFDAGAARLPRPVRGDRYVATLLGAIDAGSIGLDTMPAPVDAAPAVLEVIARGDTLRAPWPIRVARYSSRPLAVILDDDPQHRGGTDLTTIGRAYPTGTYTWFFPRGTRSAADMRIGDRVRLRLAADLVAWVPASDVQLAAAADDVRPAVMGSLTITADSFGAMLRIPLSRPAPASVDERARGLTISLDGAVSDANFTRYVAADSFVRTLTWRQVTTDRIAIDVEFDRALWGWRWHVDATDLVFEFRKPPGIDPLHPLAGRRIVIDPGHPPEGACGPTRFCEPEANLAVASRVRDALVAAGASVIMTRTGDGPVGLWPRVAIADSVDADLLVSIHANALPDGVDPFTNNGTTTYFNHLPSLPLARAVQRRLVAALRLPDLGVARGDLALVRPTWYPAILTEGLFLMIPEQEALLRSSRGQAAYARGIVEGITDFLTEAARAP